MKRVIAAALVAVTVVSLAGCSSESTSTTNFNVTTTVDGETTEYSYNSENNNGEVTTESSVTQTSENDGESDPVDEAASWLDEQIGDAWDTEDGNGHHITYDPDRIYVHVWQAGISSPDDLDEAEVRDSLAPSWIEASNGWKETLKDGGLDVGITFQFLTDTQDLALFTVEDGVLTTVYD